VIEYRVQRVYQLRDIFISSLTPHDSFLYQCETFLLRLYVSLFFICSHAFVCSVPFVIVPYFTCILGSLNEQELIAKYESPFRHIICVLKKISSSLFFFPLLSQQSAIITPAFNEIVEYLSHVRTSTTQLSRDDMRNRTVVGFSRTPRRVLVYHIFIFYSHTLTHRKDEQE